MLSIKHFYFLDTPQMWLTYYAISIISFTGVIIYARINSNSYLYDQILYFMGNIPERMKSEHSAAIIKKICIDCLKDHKYLAELVICEPCPNLELMSNSSRNYPSISAISNCTVEEIQIATNDTSSPGLSQEDALHDTFVMALLIAIFYSTNSFWKSFRDYKSLNPVKTDSPSKLMALAERGNQDPTTPDNIHTMSDDSDSLTQHGGDTNAARSVSRQLIFTACSEL
jgi:hypothetical protein